MEQQSKASVKITAERPVKVVVSPKFVKVAIGGYKPFFMSFDKDQAQVEALFRDAFGVELEPKTKEVVEKKKRGRKPKTEFPA